MDNLSFPKLGISLNLNRVAFTIFGLPIYWYGILIATGVMLAILYTQKRSREFGIHPDKLFDVSIGGLIAGMLGARIFYILFSLDEFRGNWKEIFYVRSGGLAIYGGIIGGLLAGAIICKTQKTKILPSLDVAGIGFLIGQGVGRWGNFFNMEAFGTNTDLPWGMTSKTIQSYLLSVKDDLAATGVVVDPFKPVHPTFLYESLWCFLGFILLHFYSKKRKFDGEILLMYVGWYGFGRFFIEGLRTDSLYMGNIKTSQLLAGILFLISVIIWFIVTNKIKRENDEEYLKLYVNTETSKEIIREVDEKIFKKSEKAKEAKEDFILDKEEKNEKNFEEELKKETIEKDLEKEIIEEELKEEIEKENTEEKTD